jgi:hypothetical protein
VLRITARRVAAFTFKTACLTLLTAIAACSSIAPAATERGDGASPATFFVAEAELHRPLTVIAYGDMRFTDPANVTATNPAARQALIAKITEERPNGLFLNGDVPYIGGDPKDYAEYHKESAAWRDAGLRVYPALGNHEFKGCEEQACLENWWSEFPQLRNSRWYSVQLGRQFYGIALDSDTSLLPGSAQMLWLQAQLAALPASVKFVLIWMHHPPLDDVQAEGNDNPRDNEAAVREYLKTAAPTLHARLLVVAAHVHNYERFRQDGVDYIVSGGGGAKPSRVVRTPDDLFRSDVFPNYHYVKLVLDGDTLRGTMIRLDPLAASSAWSVMDHFEIAVGK